MLDALGRIVLVKNEVVFRAGDAGDCAYLIEEGKVEIFVVDQAGERRIGLVGKDEMFGEITLIDCQPRTATARTMEKTVLVPIQRKMVQSLLEKSDPILRQLFSIILERYRGNRNTKISPQSQADEKQSNAQAEKKIALKSEVTQKISIAHGITRALAQDEFELYYQPICRLDDGLVAGFEALIRWHHPTDGLIPPMDFLWLAEQTGLIHELGMWTLERACRDWPRLRQHTKVERPFVSVNLSPSQLTSEMLASDVKAVMARHAMPPDEMKLELTETVVVERPELAVKILNQLVELGSSLALDDYGTGHSGLEHIQRYPIGTLKIDRAFIAPMLTSSSSFEIVRSSIGMARSLGLSVVAEGIETEDVRDALLDLGCEFGQGWHFGKPSPLAGYEIPL